MCLQQKNTILVLSWCKSMQISCHWGIAWLFASKESIQCDLASPTCWSLTQFHPFSKLQLLWKCQASDLVLYYKKPMGPLRFLFRLPITWQKQKRYWSKLKLFLLLLFKQTHKTHEEPISAAEIKYLQIIIISNLPQGDQLTHRSDHRGCFWHCQGVPVLEILPWKNMVCPWD